MVLPLAAVALAALLFFANRAKAARAAGELGPEQPASGLHGQPTQTIEQAGVHTYEVTTWPPQPDGALYRYVRFKDAPGQHGVLFSERQGVRKLEQATGPTDVVNTIRGEWIIGN